MKYIITEHDELLTKEEAEKHGYKIVRDATDSEILEHEKEELYWRKQADEFQQESSYHELPD